MGVYLRVNEHWQPWVNTVAYFPFENDQLDAVWTATINATWTKETIGYRFDLTNDGTTTNLTTARFVNYWVKFGSVKADENQTPFIGYGEITYNYRHTVSEFHKTISYQSWVSSWGHSTEILTTSWVWYNFAYGYDGTKVVGYLNWTKVAEITTSLYNTNNRKIWSHIDETLSNLIYETTPRTAEEVLDYYNYTKSNYWIS